MVSLILVVCLAASPETCREEQPPLEAQSGLQSGLFCLEEGELATAAWLEEHPKWMLKGWRCKLGSVEKST